MVIYRMIWTPQPASVEAVAAIIETLDNYLVTRQTTDLQLTGHIRSIRILNTRNNYLAAHRNLQEYEIYIYDEIG